MSDEFGPRLAVLYELAERLVRRRGDLMEAEGEDIGTPCTAVAMEVDMAVEHLRTLARSPLLRARPYGTVAAISLRRPAVMLAGGGAAILRTSFSSVAPPKRPHVFSGWSRVAGFARELDGRNSGEMRSGPQVKSSSSQRQ
jgi:acyl-CoA reductase-like NAD-dependent aldehyde dehydrogenase